MNTLVSEKPKTIPRYENKTVYDLQGSRKQTPRPETGAGLGAWNENDFRGGTLRDRQAEDDRM